METLNIFIGYDRDNRMPAYVLAESIMQNTRSHVNFTFLHRDMLSLVFTRQRGEFDSTDFSNSRFLVPYLSKYKGWSLFLDNDMIVKDDIQKLFNLIDNRYSVMCVKHNQVVENTTKFQNMQQTEYSMKNWTSVMLFNNSKCRSLTENYVNTENGLNMHQFRWLKSIDTIGSLPMEWNYLVDNKNQTSKAPKLVHYTNGGPYFEETADCEYSSSWFNVYNTINDV